ncbi:hypothetical protein [Gottfriedia acidiceleris]|uniref:hypothetical protein n=1 Tax=Gottfriedia acidiceleris TaxID=371036 RepID=UPI000B441EFD|nr:hypothetical protein [Gottfriedia acidiceleris]
MRHEEAVGIFYAAFVILGITIGLGVGYFTSHLIVGGFLGFGIGIGLGLLSNAILYINKD